MVNYIWPLILVLLISLVMASLLFFHNNLKRRNVLLIFMMLIIFLVIYRDHSFSIYPQIYADQKFMQTCQWVQKHTGVNDLFIAFPFSSKGDALRMVCLRSVFITYKDGGQMMYSQQYALEWNKRIKLVSEVTKVENIIKKIKKEYGVDYIFSDKKLDIKYQLVFGDGYFIYKL